MRTALLMASAAVALVTTTTFASAQYRDDPPGWRFQNRENRESNGQEPWRYRRGYYDYGYYDYGWAPGPRVVVPAPEYYDYGYAYGPSVGFRFRVR